MASKAYAKRLERYKVAQEAGRTWGRANPTGRAHVAAKVYVAGAFVGEDPDHVRTALGFFHVGAVQGRRAK